MDEKKNELAEQMHPIFLYLSLKIVVVVVRDVCIVIVEDQLMYVEEEDMIIY